MTIIYLKDLSYMLEIAKALADNPDRSLIIMAKDSSIELDRLAMMINEKDEEK